MKTIINVSVGLFVLVVIIAAASNKTNTSKTAATTQAIPQASAVQMW
jgi:hypothetical protein